MAATLQRKSSGGINFVIITKIITNENVPRNYFVIISAKICILFFCTARLCRGSQAKTLGDSARDSPARSP